jgi:SAM-dependent methyltransferase
MFEALIERKTDTEVFLKIPWDDPDFSRRMLREHLTQEHDAASRRATIIDQHVTWIHQHLLGAKNSTVLDLGCGPGLYIARLAALGHRCVGIDFSPASIEYARENSPCTYISGDVREVEFGSDYDLVMMIFGELNTFSEEDAQLIIDKADAALKHEGTLLLEVHPYETVQRYGQQPRSWYSAKSGLFSESPFLCLEESSFQPPRAVTRHYVIDAATGQITQYGSTLNAYTDSEYRHLLKSFADATIYPTLGNEPGDGSLYAIVASKR